MVGISGCGSENTFRLSQTLSIWPEALSLPPPHPPTSATLLSQNIKGSSPTCWPLWFMFCVFVLACQCVCVCVWSKYTLVCIYMPPRMSLSVCLFASNLVCEWTFVCTQKKKPRLQCVCMWSIRWRACVQWHERGILAWTGVTRLRQEECLGHMGQWVHGNSSHRLRAKAVPEVLIDKPINL